MYGKEYTGTGVGVFVYSILSLNQVYVAQSSKRHFRSASICSGGGGAGQVTFTKGIANFVGIELSKKSQFWNDVVCVWPLAP